MPLTPTLMLQAVCKILDFFNNVIFIYFLILLIYILMVQYSVSVIFP